MFCTPVLAGCILVSWECNMLGCGFLVTCLYQRLLAQYIRLRHASTVKHTIGWGDQSVAHSFNLDSQQIKSTTTLVIRDCEPRSLPICQRRPHHLSSSLLSIAYILWSIFSVNVHPCFNGILYRGREVTWYPLHDTRKAVRKVQSMGRLFGQHPKIKCFEA